MIWALLPALTLAAAAPASAQGAACNRACLSGLLKTYLDGVVAHAPAKASLAQSFRQTENAVAIAPGEGLWKLAKGLGTLQRRYFDPVTSTAAYFGTLDLANGETAIVSLRLHAAGGRADEAEWHVARPSDPGITPGAKAMFDLPTLLASPPAARVVPVAQRLPRAALLAITNSYFDGITAENGKVIRAHPGCKRLENGMGAPAGMKNDDGTGPADCMSGQGKFGVAFVAGRRFPMVDEEAQVVLAIGTFVRKPGNPKYRNQFTEFFYIDHEKIREIYAAYFFARPDQPVPNWPPYEGNFPLPADLAPPAK
jgi:hypothetical protein